MRKSIRALLVAMVLLAAVAMPVAAAEVPDDAPPIYLPLAVNGAKPPAEPERIVEGSIVVGEDPVFPEVAPKSNAPADPLPAAVPEDPKSAPVTPPAGADGIEGAAVDGWATLLNDGMESVPWPLAPQWRIFDND
ncbi:MAG: hypothetical protein ACRC1H_08420, partial [Caldilineaceae bacterium]